jgi:ABC-type multidrug transport system ATPase subunit
LRSVLSIQQLHKNYGKRKALDSLSLEIKEGSIFGLLGPNGSGKTTTLGIILQVVNPTSGEFHWFGQPPSHQQRKKIGAILESPTFYPYLSARQNLRVVAKIKEVNPHQIDEVLKLVNLYDRGDDAFKTYSLGMKQRLSIASALLADPEVLILDEPTNGLDPQGIAEVRSLIVQIAGMGKTIILTSHLLDEVQKVCTDFAVLRQGKLIYSGSVQEALAGNETIELRADNLTQLCEVVKRYPAAKTVEQQAAGGTSPGVIVTLQDGAQVKALHQFLIGEGIVLTHLMTKKQNLEQYFLEILATHV